MSKGESQRVIEELQREHKRATADTVLLMSDRAWRRGWLIGLTTGIALSAIALGIRQWIGA